MMPLARMIVPVLALFLAASALVGCAGTPRAMSEQTFAERVAAHEAQSLAQRDEIAERLLRRLEYRLAEQQSQGRSHEPFTYEVLMLSSGGQFGAFGVGVLQGWSEVQDPSFQRPEFDLVTGVSTGALIAPFSLLGTVHSIQRIDQLYDRERLSRRGSGAAETVLDAGREAQRRGADELFDARHASAHAVRSRAARAGSGYRG